MNQPPVHIGLIGYGNVGSHFAHILSEHGQIRLTVYQRKPGTEPHSPSKITFTGDWKQLEGAEVILMTVRDSAIEEVLSALRTYLTSDPIVIHCAGSVPADVIKPFFPRYGVLYPLQTFSRDKKLDYKAIPLFITASDKDISDHLRELAGYISPIVQEIDDDQRMALHIAAVFSCNYTNAFYAIGHRICQDHGIPFKYLWPLIEETADKIKEISPQEAQTGPAIRGDVETLRRHEEYLSGYNPEFEELYRISAQLINKKIKT